MMFISLAPRGSSPAASVFVVSLKINISKFNSLVGVLPLDRYLFFIYCLFIMLRSK